MDVPTRSFVISWMGLLGSASLAIQSNTTSYLLATTRRSQKPAQGRDKESSSSTFTPVRGAEERVGHEPLQGVEPDDKPAAIGPQHRQRENVPLVLVSARSFPVHSELQGTQRELP